MKILVSMDEDDIPVQSVLKLGKIFRLGNGRETLFRSNFERKKYQTKPNNPRRCSTLSRRMGDARR
jgi:hypothetical protein